MISDDGRLKECLERGKVGVKLVDLFGLGRDRTIYPKVFLQKVNKVMIFQSDCCERKLLTGLNSLTFPLILTRGLALFH